MPTSTTEQAGGLTAVSGQDAGFGLIEVLMALALAGLVGGGGLIWAFTGQQDQAIAMQKLQALTLAENLIEEAPPQQGQSHGVAGGMYWQRQVTLDKAASGPLVDAFDIAVMVTPDDPDSPDDPEIQNDNEGDPVWQVRLSAAQLKPRPVRR